MRGKTAGLWALLLALLLSGCGQTESARVEDLFTMDTVSSYELYGAGAQDAAGEVRALLAGLESELSVTRAGSGASLLRENAGGEPVEVGEDTLELLRRGVALWEETGGAFDLTLAPVSALWGFTTESPARPPESKLEEALELKGSGDIALTGRTALLPRAGMAVDFGGIAKGYASDKIRELLEGRGISSAIVRLGGNILALGRRPDGEPWRVGVRDPLGQAGDLLGVVRAEDTCVVTSGAYERFFEEDGVRYHHILDPWTGSPAESGLLSVTVVTPDGARADALSTALFVMGREGALAHWRQHRDFELVLVGEDRVVTATAGLEDSFTPQKEGEYAYEWVR